MTVAEIITLVAILVNSLLGIYLVTRQHKLTADMERRNFFLPRRVKAIDDLWGWLKTGTEIAFEYSEFVVTSEIKNGKPSQAQLQKAQKILDEHTAWKRELLGMLAEAAIVEKDYGGEIQVPSKELIDGINKLMEISLEDTVAFHRGDMEAFNRHLAEKDYFELGKNYGFLKSAISRLLKNIEQNK